MVIFHSYVKLPEGTWKYYCYTIWHHKTNFLSETILTLFVDPWEMVDNGRLAHGFFYVFFFHRPAPARHSDLRDDCWLSALCRWGSAPRLRWDMAMWGPNIAEWWDEDKPFLSIFCMCWAWHTCRNSMFSSFEKNHQLNRWHWKIPGRMQLLHCYMSAIFPAGKVCVAPAPHRISSIAVCRRHPPWWSKDGNLSEDLGPALNMGRCLTWDYDIVLLGERDAAPRACAEWCCRVSITSTCCSLGTSMTLI